MTSFPVKLAKTLARLRRPAPALGEHTAAILQALGYSLKRIAALRERGVA